MCTFGKHLAHHAAVVSSLIGIISTPGTFRLVLGLLFVLLLCFLICHSVANIHFSKHIQSLSVLAHLAVIVHTAAW